MANCNKLFRDFDGEDYLKVPESKTDSLDDSDENARDVIRNYFEKNYPGYKPKFYRQGSNETGCMIRTKDDTCDLDDGVYFKSNPDNVTATTLQKWVKEAVDGITDSTPAHRKKCITLDFKAGYNIDFPVFIFDKNNDSHPKLAVKDVGFEEDDPKEFNDHFNNLSSAQLIRIIRFLKAWCDYKRQKMPSGLAMTILAMNHYQKNDRDDISLKFTLIEIEKALKLRYVCVMPTTPKDDIFQGYDNDRKNNFLNNLASFITDAKSAIDDERNQLKASKLWKKHLGDRFPEGKDEDEAVVRAASLAGIIGNQKPFCESR